MLSVVALVVVIIAVLFAIPVTRYAIAGVVIKKEVNISVVDSITNKPVTDADVTVGSVSGKTNSEGVAHLPSVPVGNYTVNVTKNYYETTQASYNGSNPQIIVEGTGNEDDHETVLLAARDWRYLALLASRSGDDKKQLYLVDTTSGELTLIDEGSNISFSLIGWSDHSFTYTPTRYDHSSWQNGYQALKAYNAETKQLNTVDETRGQGDHPFFAQSELMVSPYILEGKLIYAKYWSIANGVSLPSDKKSSIVVVNMNNLEKQVVKEFSMNRAIQIATKLYEPQEVYFRVVVDEATPAFYEYGGSSIKTVTNTDNKFFDTSYPTYLVSPSGEKTFWSEPRDGKNALFVGDKNGDNSTELTLQSEYTAYGWFSDDYILLSKNGSELYIAPSGSLANEPVKISNYHKPQLNFSGYGYGYGGQ